LAILVLVAGVGLLAVEVRRVSASLPTLLTPPNRPLSAEKMSEYKDRSWERRVGYDQGPVEWRLRHNFERALKYSQYANALELIKSAKHPILFFFGPYFIPELDRSLVQEMIWCGGTGEDYIPLVRDNWIGGVSYYRPSSPDTGVRTPISPRPFDRAYLEKTELGIVWLPRDYAAVFTLVKAAAEQSVKEKKDLQLADLYFLQKFLEQCDLWEHSYLLENKKPPTTEVQRKAIRLWIVQILNIYAERVLSNPNRLQEPERGYSGPTWAKVAEKYYKEWYLWYGDVPLELQRFEELSTKVAQLYDQLKKILSEKRAMQEAAKKAEEAVREAERKRLEIDPSLRK